MKQIAFVFALVTTLAGCTATAVSDAPGLEPIPGSITYGGQPRTRLTKAPVGSSIDHQFRNEFGQLVYEVYIIQPDRSLKLVSRRVRRDWLSFDD
ncbi:MAG TPA: hypothetical protein VFY63_08875 [Pseudorhizobium sp.]|nr:hypothetical protein [Pseudorhizobium sp.]